MKVVLFCGGLGTRLREHSDTIPKPLVNIGARPILWHLMKYYASYGHRDFILCLGYGGDLIRKFFLNYDPREGEDFVMDHGVAEVGTEESDVPDWRIHVVDTGLHSNIGERLMRVRSLLDGEEMFLANYSDQLSDLPLDRYLSWFTSQNAVAGFVAVKPSQSFHLVDMNETGRVAALHPVAETNTWINGGYLVLRREIFDHMNDGDELVGPPFVRLAERQSLVAYRYQGFWKAMDTLKDKIAYDQLDASGTRPWMVWKR
jgi:glucose-1-phosphate cytidylyltransferase